MTIWGLWARSLRESLGGRGLVCWLQIFLPSLRGQQTALLHPVWRAVLVSGKFCGQRGVCGPESSHTGQTQGPRHFIRDIQARWGSSPEAQMASQGPIVWGGDR